MSDGWYRLPTLDASLYNGELRHGTSGSDDGDDHSEELDAGVHMVSGMEYADL